MAGDGKKKLSVNVDLYPFAEFKGKKTPEWFEARPKLVKIVQPIMIKQDLMLDPRRWKLKDLEGGVFAVARYELKLFQAQLVAIERDIDKKIPKTEKKNAKLWKSYKDKKVVPKEIDGALSEAEKKVEKLYKKLVQKIEGKVGLALDDVETGKAVAILGVLQNNLEDPDNSKDALRKASKDIGKDAQDAFEQVAKKVSNVVKFLQDQGKKMKADSKADVALQNIGKEIVDMKATFAKFDANIDTFEDMLKEIDGGKIIKRDVSDWITKFRGALNPLVRVMTLGIS